MSWSDSFQIQSQSTAGSNKSLFLWEARTLCIHVRGLLWFTRVGPGDHWGNVKNEAELSGGKYFWGWPQPRLSAGRMEASVVVLWLVEARNMEGERRWLSLSRALSHSCSLSRYFQSIVSTSCGSGVIGAGSCSLARERERGQRTSIEVERQQLAAVVFFLLSSTINLNR